MWTRVDVPPGEDLLPQSIRASAPPEGHPAATVLGARSGFARECLRLRRHGEGMVGEG